jgi:hypothetical protein
MTAPDITDKIWLCTDVMLGHQHGFLVKNSLEQKGNTTSTKTFI